MTTYNITSAAEALQITLTDTGEQQARLLESFGECADGRCACSSAEFAKVAAMDIVDDGTGITVNVQVKPGEQIDATCITDCLTDMGVTDTTENSCCSSSGCC